MAAPAAIAGALLIWSGPTVDAMRDVVFDAFQRIAPRPYDPSGPVRILDIDEESLRRIGQWPWPRDRLAQAVTKLEELGAAAITLDMIIAEPDRVSPDRILAELPNGPEKDAIAPLLAGRSHDRALAQALQSSPSVIGLVLVNDNARRAPVKAAFAEVGDRTRFFVPHFEGVVEPLPMLSAAALGIGVVTWVPDRDLIVRRVPLVFQAGDHLVPSLALETLRVAQRASTVTIRSSNASGETAFGQPSGVNTVRVGDRAFQTDPDSSVRIRYAGARPERYVPFWKLMEDEATQDALRGRVVLVGSSAAALSDLRSTPMQDSVPGVEVHAELLEQMLAGVRLSRPDFAPGIELALLVTLALFAAALGRRLAPLPAFSLVLLLIPAMGGLSWLAFSRFDLLLDPSLPGAGMLGAYFAGTLLRYRQSDGEKRQIRAAFSHYVAPAIVRAIAADPARLKLGGETKMLTVLFSDLRDFTARSEDMPAESVIRFLNTLHTPLTEAVLEEQGTVDKYIGDGLMAFCNAPLDLPDHVDRACRTALAMQARMAAIEQSLLRDIGPEVTALGPLTLGIGLSTGMACVGNMGSALRFDYSTVGDTVNTAARLEPLTRVYGVPIIASQMVAQEARGFVFLPVDTVRLKGKARSTPIYALHGAVEDLPAGFSGFVAEHQAALEAVKGRELRARRLIAGLRRRPEAGPYKGVYEVWEREIWTREDVTLDPPDTRLGA